jgi:ABC-type maltose transport system permease subunit
MRTTRWPKIPWWAIAVVAVWLSLVAGAVQLSHQHGRVITLCPMKRLTGLPCPTCGSTRAGLAMLTGEPLQAWLWNPLVVSVGAVAAVVLLVRLATGCTLRLNFTRRDWRIATAALIIAVLANWAYVLYIGA